MQHSIPIRFAALAALCASSFPMSSAHARPTSQTAAITYQGLLKSGGAALNGSVDLQFKLFDAVAAGNQIGSTLAANAVVVADGVFTSSLDFGALAFNGEERWLEISVASPAGGGIGPFVTLSPRQKLAGAPYAAFALNAALAGTYSSAMSLTNPSNAFTGTFTGIHSGGGSALTSLNASNISSGTLNNARTTATDANAPGRIVLRDASGNFSAGTISATSFVGSGAGLTNLSASNISSGTLGIANGGTGATSAVFARLNLGAAAASHNHPATDITSGNLDPLRLPVGGAWTLTSNLNVEADTLVVDPANDRVGIGIAAPTAKMEIASPDWTPLRISTTSGARGIDIHHLATSGFSIAGRFDSESANATGLWAQNNATFGVNWGIDGITKSISPGVGVLGEAEGLSGESTGVIGRADSVNGTGVGGFATATTGTSYGGYFEADSTSGRGMYAEATSTTGSTYGGYFLVSSDTSRGVAGLCAATSGNNAIGVQGQTASTTGAGVFGVSSSTSGDAVGVEGRTSSPTGHGVYGESDDHIGVGGYATATSGFNYGVYGETQSPIGMGVFGRVITASAVGPHYGVYGQSSTSGGSYGLYANGNSGASGVKSFRIDHPADPANKYLLHYSMESPEVLNVYSGRAIFDGAGEAIVDLPEYFALINKDPRYTLTAIGAAMPNLHIAIEISEASLQLGQGVEPGQVAPPCWFKIAGGSPGMKVSWEVKALRNDRWVRANAAPPVAEKAEGERGLYQNPELFGQPESAGMHRLQPRVHREPALLDEPAGARSREAIYGPDQRLLPHNPDTQR